jgi:hypothetical protein
MSVRSKVLVQSKLIVKKEIQKVPAVIGLSLLGEEERSHHGPTV